MPHRRPARVRLRDGAVGALAVAALAALATPVPARAQGLTYFVSPTGSDTDSGTSAATPFRTLQKALDLARPGTTITLAPGTYRQAVATKVAGTAAAPVTVRGPETGKDPGGRHRAVLLSPGGRVFSVNHSHYTLDGFTIDGQPNIAVSEYPATPDRVRAFKDSVQARAVNSKLVYVGAADTSRDITGITLSNMFLHGSGGECVRFRNRASNSLVVDSVIRWCGMLGQGDDDDRYKYHNAEGVYVGTSPKSTTQPLYANDTSNGIVVRDSTIETFGSECFEVKENAHHNRLENSDCRFNDEPLAFKGSNVEFRGDHNLVLGSRVTGSRGWNVKLASDAPSYDRGGNSVERSSFGGAAGAAIHNEQSTTGSSFCDNTFATTPVSDGASIGDPRRPCTDTTAPTAPTGLTARAASATSVTLSWTAATDDVGVTAYGVLRDGVQVGTTSATTYTDAGLAAGTSSTYAVVARDAAGNTSPPSSTAAVTTPAPVPAPAPAPQAIPLEAESGRLSPPMAARSDSAARGGRYVSQTSGSGTGRVTFTVTVPAAGRYTLAGRVIAPNGSSDSFTCAVGTRSATTWHLGTRTSWTWVTGPTLELAAGSNTLVVARRENGARLDAVRLTPAR